MYIVKDQIGSLECQEKGGGGKTCELSQEKITAIERNIDQPGAKGMLLIGIPAAEKMVTPVAGCNPVDGRGRGEKPPKEVACANINSLGWIWEVINPLAKHPFSCSLFAYSPCQYGPETRMSQCNGR